MVHPKDRFSQSQAWIGQRTTPLSMIPFWRWVQDSCLRICPTSQGWLVLTSAIDGTAFIAFVSFTMCNEEMPARASVFLTSWGWSWHDFSFFQHSGPSVGTDCHPPVRAPACTGGLCVLFACYVCSLCPMTLHSQSLWPDDWHIDPSLRPLWCKRAS